MGTIMMNGSVIRSVALRHVLKRGVTSTSSSTIVRCSSVGAVSSLQSVLPGACSSVSTYRSSWFKNSVRTFSDDESSSASPASDDLAEKLNRELEEEKANGHDQMPQELVDLKAKLEQEEKWKIVEDTVIKMYKQTAAFKIQLSFHCQDTVPNDQYNDNNQQYENDPENPPPPPPENKEDEGPAAVRFTVTATKAGNNKSFVLSCLSEKGALKIDSVSVSESTPDEIHEGRVDADSYQGPEYEELAEDLKDAFSIFCHDDLGLTEDMMAFIQMYTDYKEQLDYMQFLQDAKTILSL